MATQQRDTSGRFTGEYNPSGLLSGIEIIGADQVAARIRRAAERMPNECGRALYGETAIEAKESQRRTPVLTGAARASHEIFGPDINGRDISCRIEVGGPALDYVVPLHENLEAEHTNGQAKFLESTIMESKPHLADRIAKRIEFERLFL